MSPIGFFDDSISTLPPKPPRTPSVPRARSGGVAAATGNPCDGCPLNGRPKVPPTLPEGLKAIAVGIGPGPEEERKREVQVGPSGQELRQSLRLGGLDPTKDVGYANLTRCRPPSGDFEEKAWKTAAGARHCRRFLDRDLARFPKVPLLVLGTQPLAHLLGNAKARIAGHRGLWTDSPLGRKLFGARHPAGIQRERDPQRQETLLAQFRRDLARFGERFQERVVEEAPLPPILTSPEQAKMTMDWLAAYPHPWAFDIETFDAGASPSRKEVSTDPCHPDFRVRGIAIALSPSQGFWLEFGGWEPPAQGHEEAGPAPRTRQDSRPAIWQGVLAPAFGSPADKWAYSGHFDEEGLVYPGWVPEIRRRRGDGLLALVSLGDATSDSLKLEMASVDILNRPQSWSGLDKARMGTLPAEDVARGAVGDAQRTWELCQMLHARMQRGEYL